MLHTEFPGNRSSGSGEKDFRRGGHDGHLGHVTQIP